MATTAHRTAVLLAVVITLSWSGDAYSQYQWETHADASRVRGIVYRDGELFMATSGGILIYTLGSGQFEKITNTSGIPSNDLTCLSFDDAGDLWIGTRDVGVARVTMGPDGVTVRTFSPLGFPNLNITSLDFWDGEVVYGTIDGAGKFEGGVPGPTFSSQKGLPSDIVNDVFADQDVVWFATEEGAAVLDRLGFITPVSGGPPVARVIEKSDDAMWVGTENGVRRMSLIDSTWSQIGPQATPIYSLFWDGQTMWAGGTYIVHEWDEGQSTWTDHSLRNNIRKFGIDQNRAELKGLCRTPGGDVFAGGESITYANGFHLVRVESPANESLISNGPGENRLLRLANDIDGSLWVTAKGFGVGKLTSSGQWVNYNRSIPESDSLSNLFTNIALLVDQDGHKWFSSQTDNEASPKLLDELDDKTNADYSDDEWTRHPLGSGGGDTYGTLRPQRARLDPSGNRWFLADDAPDMPFLPESWRGVHILSRDKTEWLQISPVTETRLKGGNVIDVAFREDGTVFLALYNYGVQTWYTGGYDWLTLKDPANDLWGGYGGEMDASVDDSFTLGRADEVRSVILRSDGVLWIGTDAGVFKHTPPLAYNLFGAKLGNEVGLLSPSVQYLELDHQENLWVATDMGLNRIAREDDNDITAYTTAATYQLLQEAGVPYLLSVISPLAGPECLEMLMHPSLDLLYAATNGGLSIIDITPRAQQATNLEGVYLYPNPIDGSRGHSELKIDRVDLPVSIDIYNVEGNLVHSQTASQSGDVVWDLTTQSGFYVASGVYFVRVDNGVSAKVFSVAVIR